MKKMIKKTLVIGTVALLSGMTVFAAVTEKEAVDIALSDAGITRDEASWLNSHRDRDDGRVYYDVEFRSDEGKWEYEIDSESGKIVGFDFEESRSRASFNGSLDRSDAERMALSDAGLTRDDVSRFRIETDRDDGRVVYEISFNTPEREYDYDIDTEDGVIISASWEKRGRVGGDRDAQLSQSDAEAIALEAIGGDAERLSVWEEWDDGRFWYEADAVIGDYSYEVDIAGTGEVVSVSRDYRGFWK